MDPGEISPDAVEEISNLLADTITEQLLTPGGAAEAVWREVFALVKPQVAHDANATLAASMMEHEFFGVPTSLPLPPSDGPCTLSDLLDGLPLTLATPLAPGPSDPPDLDPLVVPTRKRPAEDVGDGGPQRARPSPFEQQLDDLYTSVNGLQDVIPQPAFIQYPDLSWSAFPMPIEPVLSPAPVATPKKRRGRRTRRITRPTLPEASPFPPSSNPFLGHLDTLGTPHPGSSNTATLPETAPPQTVPGTLDMRRPYVVMGEPQPIEILRKEIPCPFFESCKTMVKGISERGFLSHMGACHAEDQPELVHTMQTNPGSMPCPFKKANGEACEKTVRARDTILRHWRTAHGPPEVRDYYECTVPVCMDRVRKTDIRKDSMKNHMRRCIVHYERGILGS